nr:hypothetical protein [Flavobacteriales bacterium]
SQSTPAVNIIKLLSSSTLILLSSLASGQGMHPAMGHPMDLPVKWPGTSWNCAPTISIPAST